MRKVKAWQRDGQRVTTRDELGQACLVDEMQVLVANGWAHV